MQEFAFPHDGWTVNLNSTDTMPWSAQVNFSLPYLIAHSIEDYQDIEIEALDYDGILALDSQDRDIIGKLKDILTVSQYEQFEVWRKVYQDILSRKNEAVYFAGARTGIKYAKQCEDIGDREGVYGANSRSQRCNPIYMTPMDISNEIGLPISIAKAFSGEISFITNSDLVWDINMEDQQFEKKLASELKKSLVNEQLELLATLDDLLLKKSFYVMEYMFYSGIKHGIMFYKEYQTI